MLPRLRSTPIALCLLLGLLACSNHSAAPDFREQADWAVGVHPADVLDPEALRAWQAGGAEDVLLVDTRSPREYAVSHLPGAVLWPP